MVAGEGIASTTGWDIDGKDTFQRMTDLQSVVHALQEFDVFRQKVGEY